MNRDSINDGWDKTIAAEYFADIPSGWQHVLAYVSGRELHRKEWGSLACRGAEAQLVSNAAAHCTTCASPTILALERRPPNRSVRSSTDIIQVKFLYGEVTILN